MAMIVSEGLRVAVKCSRMLSTSSASKDWEKQGRFMRKFLSEKVERKLRDVPKANQTFKLLDKKRSAVLSSLYMQNITEALSFGGFTEIEDIGIEITHVAVKNSGIVEVFWNAAENEDHVQIQEILSSIAGKVRNKLMYGAMMGNVPNIIFKRDLSTIQMNETLQHLHKISVELEATKKNSQAENTLLVSETEIAPVAPTMRMDTFGLPHDKIYRRIMECKKNSYPLQAPVPPTPEEFACMFQGETASPTESPEVQSKKKKELEKFIKLYQKSALNSSTRKKCLQDTRYTLDYDEEDFEEHVDKHR